MPLNRGASHEIASSPFMLHRTHWPDSPRASGQACPATLNAPHGTNRSNTTIAAQLILTCALNYHWLDMMLGWPDLPCHASDHDPERSRTWFSRPDASGCTAACFCIWWIVPGVRPVAPLSQSSIEPDFLAMPQVSDRTRPVRPVTGSVPLNTAVLCLGFGTRRIRSL
jgi:hypothetical protein